MAKEVFKLCWLALSGPVLLAFLRSLHGLGNEETYFRTLTDLEALWKTHTKICDKDI